MMIPSIQPHIFRNKKIFSIWKAHHIENTHIHILFHKIYQCIKYIKSKWKHSKIIPVSADDKEINIEQRDPNNSIFFFFFCYNFRQLTRHIQSFCLIIQFSSNQRNWIIKPVPSPGHHPCQGGSWSPPSYTPSSDLPAKRSWKLQEHHST